MGVQTMSFVKFENVYKRYKMGEITINAADGVSFEIEKGEFAVIVGASGAGKTTILNMLGGMDTCDEGKILVDGKDIATFNKKQLTTYRRYDIGFVFQFYNLVNNLTAKENVELADHRDEQQPNGVLPDIIPTGGWGYGTDNGLDWTSTIALIPWNIYMFYGDHKLLADCYENIKRYVDYVDRTSPTGLTSWGRGDWVPVKSHSSKELTSSVYFYVDTKILANAAKMFNKTEDYKYYSALANKIKNAINDKFLNRETGIYGSGVQTEQSVPLQWGIVPEELKRKVARNLAKQVEAAGFHLDVGVLGAKAILNALSENGEAETAYKLAAQDTYPSWGCWIANGATTLLENWDLNATRDISDNHMMFGEIGGWFYKGLGGIFPDPENPGFKTFCSVPIS